LINNYSKSKDRDYDNKKIDSVFNPKDNFPHEIVFLLQYTFDNIIN
jgi:hypothetical protein